MILALGIGVNTAMFSVVNGLLSGPPAVGNSHRLVNLYQNDAVSGQPLSTPYPVYEDITTHTDLFTGVAAFSLPVPVRFYRDGTVRSGLAEFATSSYPAVLELDLAMGRWFTPDEERPGAGAVAVVSHQAWTTKFDASPSVIGETLFINGTPTTVVGVGPAGYGSSFHAGVITDFWLSVPSLASVMGRPDMLERDPDEAPFVVKARLRSDVSVGEAEAAMAVLGAQLARQYPEADPGRGISLLPSDSVRIHPQFDMVLNYGASVLMILVGLLLAIACSNLATWLVVRGLSRAREVGLRRALGATRWQVVRHLLVESTMLASLGGALGCALAVWTIRLIGLLDLPLDAEIGLDARVLAFSLLLSLLTGVTFGLAPALSATRINLLPTIRAEGGALAGGRSTLTLKNALVLGQVALSCVLLVWAGVFVERLAEGQSTDLGFDIGGLAFLETDAGFLGHDETQSGQLYETLRDRIAALPGVASATLAVGPPPAWQGRATDVTVDTVAPNDEAGRLVRWIWAGPRYFETLQIPLLYGRTFTDADRPDTPGVVVVNEAMAPALLRSAERGRSTSSRRRSRTREALRGVDRGIRSHRRRGRHPDLAVCRGPAALLSLLHPGRGGDPHGAGPNHAAPVDAAAADAGGAPRSGRRTPPDHGSDDVAARCRLAASPAHHRRGSGWPRRAGAVPREPRTLRHHGLRRLDPDPRDRDPDGAGCAPRPSRLDGLTRRGDAGRARGRGGSWSLLDQRAGKAP